MVFLRIRPTNKQAINEELKKFMSKKYRYIRQAQYIFKIFELKTFNGIGHKSTKAIIFALY